VTIVASAFVVIGVGLLAVGVAMLRRGRGDRQRVAGWVPAQGTVTGVDRDTVSPMTADATVTLRYAIVRYVDAHGRPQEGRARTASSRQRPVQGQPVGLRYDPRDPQRVVLDGAPVGSGVVGGCAGIAFTVFGVFWILVGLAALGLTTR
jgi:uncharacterized protein DUF3592